MIYCLTGKIVEKSLDSAVIDCGGVGYLVSVPASTSAALAAVGQNTTVYTVMHTSENDISLYGFSDTETRSMFIMLTSVSGVGPKAGLAIVSALKCSQIVMAISAGDHKTFTAANGVGPKLAQRIVLELKDKVGKGLVDTSGATIAVASAQASGSAQAMAALLGLGYTAAEAAAALADIDPTLPTAEMIRLALQNIGKRR